MREKTIKIWREKTDWIAKNGGMVLVNVHPDYIDFNISSNSREEFSINLYKEFLIFLINSYKNDFLNTLPMELAKNYLINIKGNV
jgi:hypothetical protein